MDRGHDVCWVPGWVVSNPENISPRSCGRSARCDQGRLQHRDCGCVITTEGMRRARKMTKRRIERRLKCRGRRKGPGARCNPPRSLRGKAGLCYRPVPFPSSSGNVRLSATHLALGKHAPRLASSAARLISEECVHKLIFQTRHGDTAGVGGLSRRSLLFHLQHFLDPEVHAA